MIDSDHILISLDPRHAKKIYKGTKKVELRRRVMNIKPGTTIWFYEKVPVGAITGFSTVKTINTATPEQLWQRFSSVAGIHRTEFFKYFANARSGCALELEEVEQLDLSIGLTQLRQLKSNFQPPQFFTRLSETHPFFSKLSSLKRQYPHSTNAVNPQPILLVA